MTFGNSIICWVLLGVFSNVWCQAEYNEESGGPYPASNGNYNGQYSSQQQYRNYASPPSGPSGPGPAGPGPVGAGPIGPGPGPVGPGPVGPGSFGPGPFGPGPLGPPFPPIGLGGFFGGLTPWCASIEAFRTRLYHVAEPIIVVGLSVLFIWFLKHILLPHFSLFTTSFRSRRQDVDSITAKIIDAIDSNVCMERIICNLGASAGKYSMTKPVIKLLDKTLFKAYNPLLKIFKFAATEENTNCQEFKCSSFEEQINQDEEIKKE